MKIHATRLAVFGALGVIAGVFELTKTGLEFAHVERLRMFERQDHSFWVDVVLICLSLLSVGVVTHELRHRFRVLRRREVAERLVLGANCTIGALIIGTLVHSIYSDNFPMAAVGFMLFIPFVLLMLLHATLEGSPADPNLFEWEAAKRRQAEEEAERQRRDMEHGKYLKDNPAEAAYERMSFQAKIKSGLLG
jgi:hypothetical protein